MRAPGRDGAGRSQREHQIEGHLQEKIRTRYPTLRSAFRAIDRSNNGYISEADFAEALRRVFLPTLALADADVAAVARRFDLNGDGFVSFHEFATRMEGRDCEGAARAEPHREASELNSQADMAMQALRQSLDMKFATQREAFLSLPKDAKSALDEASVRDALRSRSIDLPPAQLEQVWRRLGGGEAAKTVSYRDFWRKMSNGSRFAGHLDRQMFRDPEDALAEEPRAAGAASPEAEAPRALEGAALEGLLGDLWADLRAAFDRLDRKCQGYVLEADLAGALAASRPVALVRGGGAAAAAVNAAAVARLLSDRPGGFIECEAALAAADAARRAARARAAETEAEAEAALRASAAPSPEASPARGEPLADAAAPVSAPPSPAPPPRAPAAAAANRPSAADRAERALRQAAELRFRDLHSMFQVLDRGNNGYVSGAEFVEALSRDILCSFGFSEADLAELAGRFDLNGDGFVSFNEFAHYLEGKDCDAVAATEPVRRKEDCVGEADLAMQLFRKFLDRRYESLRQAFRALSAAGGAGRDARFDRTDLAAVLRANCAGVSEDQVDEIFRRFDSSGSGDVSYPEFCAVMSQSAVFGGHLDRQTFRDPPPRAGAAGPAGGWAPAARADFRPPRGFQPPPRSAAVGFQPPPRSAAPF